MCFRTKISLLLLALFVGAGVLGFNVTQDAVATNMNDDTATAVASEGVKAVAFDKLANLQQYIEQLKTKIAELQKKLRLAREGVESAEWCHTFRRNLKYGNAGAEVRALQTALKKEGFTEVDKDTFGKFGMFTSSAVVGFQEKYKAEILDPWGLEHGTGFVGKTTREKLNKLYGCGVTPVPPVIPVEKCTSGEEKKYTCPDDTKVDWCTCEDEEWVCIISPENQCETQPEKSITVISPNGSEKWQAGRTYQIRWKLTKSGVWIQSTEANDTDNTEDTEDSSAVAVLDRVDIYLVEDSLADSSACTENGTCCYTCTNWELIASDISAYPGKYAWTIDGDQTIGDKYKIFIRTKGNNCFSGCVSDDSNDYFSVVAEGTQACTDSDEGKDYYVKGTTCRTVASGKTFCRTDICLPSMAQKILSFLNRDKNRIKGFLKEYYCRGDKMVSRIYRCPNGCENGACVGNSGELTCRAKCIAEGYHTGICRKWTVTLNAEMGCKTGELNVGPTSDCSVPTNWVGASKTCCCRKQEEEPTPSITVTAPNGGETWVVGGGRNSITWNATGYDAGTSVQIGLRDERYSIDTAEYETTIANTTNTGSYIWMVPSTFSLTSEGASPTHKIVIYIDGGGPGKYDLSDNYFSIVEP